MEINKESNKIDEKSINLLPELIDEIKKTDFNKKFGDVFINARLPIFSNEEAAKKFYSDNGKYMYEKDISTFENVVDNYENDDWKDILTHANNTHKKSEGIPNELGILGENADNIYRVNPESQINPFKSFSTKPVFITNNYNQYRKEFEKKEKILYISNTKWNNPDSAKANNFFIYPLNEVRMVIEKSWNKMNTIPYGNSDTDGQKLNEFIKKYYISTLSINNYYNLYKSYKDIMNSKEMIKKGEFTHGLIPIDLAAFFKISLIDKEKYLASEFSPIFTYGKQNNDKILFEQGFDEEFKKNITILKNKILPNENKPSPSKDVKKYYKDQNENGIYLNFIDFLLIYGNFLKKTNDLVNAEKLFGSFSNGRSNSIEFTIKLVSEVGGDDWKEKIFNHKTITSEELLKYDLIKILNENIKIFSENVNNYFQVIKETLNKTNIIKNVESFIETAGNDGSCLNDRQDKIKSDCGDRVKEGYMINRSLADLSKGISKIGSNTFGKDGFPLYLERQIDPKCRNQFIDYFTFDKYVTQDNIYDTIDNDIDEYGIILTIIKRYFGVDLNELFVYTLLVYNTSFFKAPAQNNYKLPLKELENNDSADLQKNYDKRVAYPYRNNNFNVGYGNNPPNPPYVNINFMKYFCNINKDITNLLTSFDKFKKYVSTYEFYNEYFGNDDYYKTLFPDEIKEGIAEEELRKRIKLRMDFVESYNAATLLGTLETTDTLQSIMYKDVGCSMVKNDNYKEILELYNEKTSKNVTECKEALKNSKFNVINENVDTKIDNIFRLRSATEIGERAKNAKGGRKTRKKYRKKNKTVGKKVIRFNRSKLRTKKPKKTKRK